MFPQGVESIGLNRILDIWRLLHSGKSQGEGQEATRELQISPRISPMTYVL